MKKFLTRSVRISASLACLLVLAISAFAQATLRKAVDTDLDNKADFTVFRPENSVWYTLKSSGGFSFVSFGDSKDDFVTPGDYDGDGKGDVSVYRDSTGIWYRLNSSNNTFAAVSFGISGDEPIARDYDGDGKTDVAVVRRTGGKMYWYFLRSIDGSFGALSFGDTTDFTAPGDYDGDGKFDFAVQRPNALGDGKSLFYVLKLDGSLIVQSWGNSNDVCVPGDYDGDGKTDFAIVREGATKTDPLTWYVLQSSNGGLKISNLGITGTDLTAQNDYDGDGKTDFAIYRDTTGAFTYVSSLTGQSVTVAWGQSGDFPVAGYDTH